MKYFGRGDPMASATWRSPPSRRSIWTSPSGNWKPDPGFRTQKYTPLLAALDDSEGGKTLHVRSLLRASGVESQSMGAEIPLPRRALSVEDYHRMGEVGLFAPEERLELIHGDLLTMAPIGGKHLRLVNVLAQLFSMQVGRSAVVSVQNPICIPPDSEPQPDIVLLRSECWARAAVPTATDILLVIEIADTTLARDREIKIPLYARHGIPEAWLFDIAGERTTIYRDPGPVGYRMEDSPARDLTISPQLRPDVAIPLAEVWLATAR